MTGRGSPHARAHGEGPSDGADEPGGVGPDGDREERRQEGEAGGPRARGVLEQHLRELVVRCLPTAIPEQLTVDVAHLRVGGSLHVRDLPPHEGIEIVSPPEEVIAAVVMPKVEEVAAPAEAAAPAEPEVI